MGLTDVEIGKIVGAWEDRISSWKTFAESDHTQYDIDDSDYQDAVNAGKEEAKSYKQGSKAGQITRTTVDGILAVGGNTVGKAYGCKAIQDKHLSNVEAKAKDEYNVKKESMHPDEFETETGGKTESEYAENAKSGDEWNVGLLVACAFDVATAAMYRISKPNEKQKETVDAFAENMAEIQETTCRTQDDLQKNDAELIDLNDCAGNVAGKANSDMADARTEFQFHQDVIRYFDKAKTSGYTNFTQEDIEAYQESVQYMTEVSEEVNTTQEEAESNVQEIYDDMSGYQDAFDDAAENIGNVDGFTEEASKVDESTQIQCYIEGASQGINALGAAKDGYEAIAFGTSASITSFGTTLAYVAAGGLALAAGVSDGFASAEQFKWASETGNEIDARVATQDLNTGTQEIYKENNDYYQGYMENVEQLNVVRPDDMKVPEKSTLVAPSSEKNDNQDKKKKQSGNG